MIETPWLAASRRNWSIRPYRPGDEKQIVILFETVFKKPISEDYWRWKLRGNPGLFENVWVVEQGERLIGQYAAIPTPVVLKGNFPGHPDGSRDTIMIGTDAMVHPEFRRQGLLTSMIHHAHASWTQSGALLILGLPNQQWGSRINALGWKDLFDLRYIHRPLRPESILARRTGIDTFHRMSLLGRLANLDLHPSAPNSVHSSPDRQTIHSFVDQLWETNPATEPIAVIRDGKRMVWRYGMNPDTVYQVLLSESGDSPSAYLVYNLEKGDQSLRAAITEVYCPPDSFETGVSLIRQALVKLIDLGAESAFSLAIPGTLQYHLLRRAGFLFSSYAFRIRTVIFDPVLSLERLRKPQAWELGGGDFDLL